MCPPKTKTYDEPAISAAPPPLAGKAKSFSRAGGTSNSTNKSTRQEDYGQSFNDLRVDLQVPKAGAYAGLQV